MYTQPEVPSMHPHPYRYLRAMAAAALLMLAAGCGGEDSEQATPNIDAGRLDSGETDQGPPDLSEPPKDEGGPEAPSLTLSNQLAPDLLQGVFTPEPSGFCHLTTRRLILQSPRE